MLIYATCLANILKYDGKNWFNIITISFNLGFKLKKNRISHNESMKHFSVRRKSQRVDKDEL